MSHFEDLLAEFYSWSGCVVQRNKLVGRRAKGGWEMELDVVVFDPKHSLVLHLEPSLDAQAWERREERFAKKFAAGRKYIATEVLPWMRPDVSIRQIAILPGAGPARRTLAGAAAISVDEAISHIVHAVRQKGVAARGAVPEQFPLLRTIQFVVSGYQRLTNAPDDVGKILTVGATGGFLSAT